MKENLLSRITCNSKVCNGKPTIRNMRFTVHQLLELLAAGMSYKEILGDYDYLELEDIEAVLLYASRMMNGQHFISQQSNAPIPA